MARAIDADRLLQVLETNFGHTGGADVMRQLIEAQPALTPPNGRVSVEDTVPDPGVRVLATDGIFVGEAYRTSANSWFRHAGFPWRDGVTGRTVRFWTPMPAPPDRRTPEGEA